MSESIPLPPLQVAELDEATLQALFTDITALGENVSVSIRRSEGVHVRDLDTDVPAPHALAALLNGSASGVLLRYRHAGTEWSDTVMRGATGFRLVRMGAPPELVQGDYA